MTVAMEEPFILFDDARAGGAPPRLYREPFELICATESSEVRPALERLGDAVNGGAHAAGFLAYEAGLAFEQRLAGSARRAAGRFSGSGCSAASKRSTYVDWLPDPAGGWVGQPEPRMSRGDYLAAAERVREHLFAGDFYQANLTFGCDVAVAGDPLAIYARLRRASAAGWGGVMRHPEGWLVVAFARAILHHSRAGYRSQADEGHCGAKLRSGGGYGRYRRIWRPTPSSAPKI